MVRSYMSRNAQWVEGPQKTGATFLLKVCVTFVNMKIGNESKLILMIFRNIWFHFKKISILVALFGGIILVTLFSGKL